jgi:hypothetical protein
MQPTARAIVGALRLMPDVGQSQEEGSTSHRFIKPLVVHREAFVTLTCKRR